MLVLCLDLAKKCFRPFLLSVFKLIIGLILKITFRFIFSGYKNIIFHSKYVILIESCLVLTNSLFSINFLGGLKINCSVIIEN